MAYKENYPSKLLEDAVDAISSLPGVGRRSALRLALHLLKQPVENVHHFTTAIDRLRDDVKYCRHCRMISDDEALKLLSKVRLGVAMQIVDDVSLGKIQSLMIDTLPNTLKTVLKQDLSKEEEEIKRAEYIRRELK